VQERETRVGEIVLRLVRSTAGAQTSSDFVDLRAAGDQLSVGDVRENGRRVDVRLRDDQDRAWLVVVWFTDRSLDGVESITVYPRPHAFDGVAGGLVIVLNGPSSVGKSTLMRTFADRALTPFACIDEPLFGRPPARFSAWPETLGPHVDGVLAGVAAAARLGNQFVMSAAGIPQSRFESALADVERLYVGLDGSLDVLVQRQLAQADKFGRLVEESMSIHDGWRYDLRIDTVDESPDAAARLLVNLVRQRYGRTP
jgi:chloramphenicol 3-O-phosphotransferase